MITAFQYASQGRSCAVESMTKVGWQGARSRVALEYRREAQEGRSSNDTPEVSSSGQQDSDSVRSRSRFVAAS